MKSLKYLVGVLAAAVMFAGCDLLPGLTGGVKLNKESLSFDADGGSETVGLSSLANWNSECAADWITVSPDKGYASSEELDVTITVDPSDGERREAEVIFTVGDSKSVSLRVIQRAVGDSGEGGGGGDVEIPSEVHTVSVASLMDIPDQTLVKVVGVVMATYERGFILCDGMRNGNEDVLVYEGVNASGQEVGDFVEVVAMKSTYRNQAQLSAVESINRIGPKEVHYPDPHICTPGNVHDLMYIVTAYYQFTGILEDSGSYLYVMIEGTDVRNRIEFPFDEDEAVLRQHIGEQVTITGYYIGYSRSEDGLFTMATVMTDYVVPEYTPISDIVNLSQDTEVLVKGQIMARYTNGFILSDGSYNVLVYEGTTPSEHPVGSIVAVRALRTVYASQAQLSKVISVEGIGFEKAVYPKPTICNAGNISNILNNERPSYIQYTGKVEIAGTTSNGETVNWYRFVIDGTDIKGTIQYPIPEHYDELAGMKGKTVTVTGYHIGVRTSTNTSTGAKTQYVNTMAMDVVY